MYAYYPDECLTYALQNRAEWQERGEAIVEVMVQKQQQQQRVTTARCTMEQRTQSNNRQLTLWEV
jgi:hypothetical protein